MTQKNSSPASLGSSTDFFQSPEDLQRFFFHAPIAIALIAYPTYSFTMANQRYLDLVGKTSEEVIGREVFDVMSALASDLKIALDQVIRTGQRSETNELRLDNAAKTEI